MRYKAVLDDGAERTELTEEKRCIEDVLKALHNKKPGTKGTIPYEPGAAEAKILRGELNRSVRGHGNGRVKFERKWTEVGL